MAAEDQDDQDADDRLDELTTVVRLGGPADLLGVLPYRIGFHPQESLVVVCLEGRRRRDRLVLRVDLPDPAYDGALAADLAARVAHTNATTVVLVVWTEAPDPIPDLTPELARAGLVEALGDALADHGIDMLDALLVRSGRWSSYLCPDFRCCPPEGTPIPEIPTPAALAYAAESVVRGRALLPDRPALRRSVDFTDDASADELAGALDSAEAALTAARLAGGDDAARALTLGCLESMLAARAAGETGIEVDDGAVVLRGLRDDATREDVMTAYVEDVAADLVVSLLADLARRARDDDAAPVCAALAWVAYAAGNGALATVAAERALRGSPENRVADLVLAGMDQMVPPATIRRVSAAVRGDRGAVPGGPPPPAR